MLKSISVILSSYNVSNWPFRILTKSISVIVYLLSSRAYIDDHYAWLKISLRSFFSNRNTDTVDSGYKGMLNRGNSGYRGQFAADQNFYLVKAGQIEEKGAF